MKLFVGLALKGVVTFCTLHEFSLNNFNPNECAICHFVHGEKLRFAEDPC